MTKALKWCEQLLCMMILVVAFAALAAMPVFAQTLPTVSGTAVDSPPAAKLVLLPIGKSFGSRGQWQFGIDKGATFDVCGAYAVISHQFLAGYCRDVFVLARDGQGAFHLGAAILYGHDGSANYLGRIGATVGPAASAAAEKVSANIPYFEELASVKAPLWAAYLGKVTTVDYFGGRLGSSWDHGPEAKVSIPLEDLKALLPSL